MAIERLWERQGPVAFTADGGSDGLVKVDDVVCFKVKQRVVISSATQPNLVLQVKKVLSLTQLIVGPLKDKTHPAKPKNNLLSRTDISAYTLADGASIRAEEQSKVRLDPRDIVQATYEQEPTIAWRVFNVDKVGNGYTVENPFPVIPSDGQDTLEINADGSINVNVITTTVGTPIIHLEPGTITDTSETIVATFTATAANSKINRLLGEAHTFGEWRMYTVSVAPANLKAIKRTSFSERTADLKLEQPEVLANGGKLIVTFRAQRYRASFLGASSTTFVRLEGVS